MSDEILTTSEESSDSENDVPEEESDPTVCLFCEKSFKSVDVGIQHLKISHSFDLTELKKKFCMDQYSYIKLINFIRANKANPTSITESKIVLWNDEKYLKPLEYETWLTYDFEYLNGNLENEKPNEDHENFKKQDIITEMSEQIEIKNQLLQQANEDIKRIREGFKRIVKDGVNNPIQKEANERKAKFSDESYFSSYSHFNIHHEMLSDTVRTEAYRNAFLKNKAFVKDKTVLDIGCGTSILSMFASSAGAKHVVGIDNSDVIYNAMEIIRKNKCDNITLIKGKIEETSLQNDKFDIIVSEWMGYFLLFEGMLDSIIYGRDRYLKSGGTLMPNRCTISIVAYGNENRYDEYIAFWDSVYGFDMSSIKSEVLREPSFEICDPKYILSDENIIADYNLNTVSLNYSNFNYDFQLKCSKDGVLTSFMGYFDTFFDLPEQIWFSTSALSKPTHWKQALFYLDKKINVKKDEIISGTIICRRSDQNVRSLNITIKVFETEFNYNLD